MEGRLGADPTLMIPVLIIPVLNRHDLLTLALDNIDYPIDNLLIINNGLIDNYEYSGNNFINNIKILNLPSNLGVAASWNLGIKLYPHAPYWAISSADTIIPSGWIEKISEMSGKDFFVYGWGHNFFTIGEDIVRRVGLFDEYIYPAYFEDNDYDDRINLAGLNDRRKYSGLELDTSKGSQTIHSDKKLMDRNGSTFVKNQEYYFSKKNSGDYTCRGWDIDRRRQNEWLI